MGEIVNFPLRAPTAASTLEYYTWEAILQDLPPRSRKRALITAYRGGKMPARIVSHFMEQWRLKNV